MRSEDLEHYDQFFVDPVDPASVMSNNNQLIYGRRGSGKTMLLGALTERFNVRTPHDRVAALYFTATDFYSSPDRDDSASPRERTHFLFHGFIERMCTEIATMTDRLLKRPRWFERITLEGDEIARRRDFLENHVLELLEVASYGVESPHPSSVSTNRRDLFSDKASTSRSSAFSAKVTAGVRPAAGLDASHGRGEEDSATAETSVEVVRQPARRFSPHRVRELVVAIVDLLGLDYLVIFIDEWMSLGECQVDFAERLRRTLFGDRRLAIKIAADQFQGKFNNSGQGHNFRGLDIGGDIFVAVDLDKPFQDPDRQELLFAEALYRRLSFFEPELKEHFGPSPLMDRRPFLDTIFATPRAFSEVCHGAHGLVRDFHEIVAVSFKRLNTPVSASQRIDVEAVRGAIVKRNDAIYDRAVHSTSSNHMLFKIIAPHVRVSRSRFFIVESRPGPHTPTINDLLTKRIIHSVPGELLHPSIRGEYDCFEITYGIYIDMIRALEFSTGERIDDTYQPSEIAAITSSSQSNYLLDLTSISGDGAAAQTLLCHHCQTEFLSTDKAYVVRHICPQCYLDQ